MSTIIRKVGDTARVWTATLTYGGQPVILTDSSVIIKIKNVKDGTVRTGSCSITNPSGSVSYTPTADDVGTVGKYLIEFFVTYPDTTNETTPTDGYHNLFVNPTVDA